MARKRVDEELAAIKEALKKMRAALVFQPNISAVVKGRMGQLEHPLGIIQPMRCLWRVSTAHRGQANAGPFPFLRAYNQAALPRSGWRQEAAPTTGQEDK